MRLKTVSINLNGSPCLINERDFNPDVHKLWDVEEVENEPAKVEAIAVHKGGGRWVVEVDGEPAHTGVLSKAEAKALAAEY